MLDLPWLGVIAKSIYQQGLGHLMADRPNFPVAVLFYAVLAATLFGFIAYATYDLTSPATLKNWPVGLSALDMAWGTLLGVTSAAAGKFALDYSLRVKRITVFYPRLPMSFVKNAVLRRAQR